MNNLLKEIASCRLCEPHLPKGARPIINASPISKIILLSQAPGIKAHTSGVAYQDQSGETLRSWLGVDNQTFYNPENFGILPMGFCYPGKGVGGDLPPSPLCAPTWHKRFWQNLYSKPLVLLIGRHAQNYYLKRRAKKTLTLTVREYQEYLPQYFPIPHPSPRNRVWLQRNGWFESEILPVLKNLCQSLLKKDYEQYGTPDL